MKESIKLFLRSNVSEDDAYNIPKEGLVSLREYFETLKKADRRFLIFTEDERNIIKSTLPWVNEIGFDGMQDSKSKKYYTTSIYLYAYDGINLVLSYNEKTGLYEDSAKNLTIFDKLNPKTAIRARRQKDLYKIQDLLAEIESIGKGEYKGCLATKKSASGEFDISYAPIRGLSISSDYDLVASFNYRKTRFKDRPYLRGKASENLLDLIKMKEKDVLYVSDTIYRIQSVFRNKEMQDIAYGRTPIKKLELTMQSEKTE